jgi:hypothetical protein
MTCGVVSSTVYVWPRSGCRRRRRVGSTRRADRTVCTRTPSMRRTRAALYQPTPEPLQGPRQDIRRLAVGAAPPARGLTSCVV